MSRTYFIHGHSIGLDGEKQAFWSKRCEAKDAPLWWQEKELSFTASGYSRRLPTRTMVRFDGKWRRVYCCIYSNVGTCYIGKLSDNLIVREYGL